jgi:hypothetical protein
MTGVFNTLDCHGASTYAALIAICFSLFQIMQYFSQKAVPHTRLPIFDQFLHVPWRGPE